MRIGTKSSLTGEEQVIAKILAAERADNAFAAYGSDSATRMDDRPGHDLHLQGIAGEFAFCKLFNLYPDFTTHARSKKVGDDDGDASMPDGKRVDIKTTHRPHGRLLVVSWAKPVVEWYALMVGTFPDYEFKGFMEARELLRDQRLTDLGHGLSFVADQAELKEAY